ncbi:hypothetical protein I3F58_09575 [Streptomyces sp. MUM 203J]|uniref:hypothetical protein n=1 Tax=Streptomyces sp. MUM 203J TaxID=2791990 RepID=UPI001F03C065|nr:hypothetical protein [Streptomyces sp. MUM 203J]MCH0539809.1 hypothetical protein [Streptomyces sp. MUM 203J]
MADMFACAACGAALTVPVSRVAVPAHARQRYGHGLLPGLMEAGTYAVETEPYGPPWRRWDEVGAEEAAAQGVFAPVPALSYGPSGSIVLAPGDTRDTVVIPDRTDGLCCGTDGRDGPNLACEGCGEPVATLVDDCGHWQAVRFVPHAVHRLPGGARAARLAWEDLAEQWPATPPVEQQGYWSPQWEAAVGAALAHVLAASAGVPVAVPDGLLTDTFGRALRRLLPSGPQERRLGLSGPGLPLPDPAPDIALVPRHPQTGEVWQPPAGDLVAVPLYAEVWLHLAFARERSLLPVTGGMPAGELRDDPLPPRPWELFRPDRQVFADTLVRLPAVRLPWLREIYDRFRDRGYTAPF